MFAARTAWDLRPNRFTLALARHRAAGRELLDLSESNPTRVGLEYDHGLLAACADPRALVYQPEARGLPGARQAVAAYYGERGERACQVPVDRILLTTSTSEAYTFLFRLLCDPGDELLVAAPSYPLFDFLAGLQDVRLVSYPLFYDHGWHIDVHALEKAVTARTRAVLVVHPNNPTGSYANEREREQLSALCAERSMALIADEVFLDSSHDGTPRPSFAENTACLTFTLSGVSKVSALPQMKLAWLVTSGPEELAQPALARLEVIADTYLSLNTPTQLAAPALLTQRHSLQRQLMARIRANLAALDAGLAGQDGCTRLATEGGWYAVLRVPVVGSDEDLAIALLEKQSVLVHPGHFYDFPGEGYLVISLIVPESCFSEGVLRLLPMVNP